MYTRIIGDTHGQWEEYHKIATDAINFGNCERTIQVGDFCVGFSGLYWHDRVNEFHWDGAHRFIRGNHDAPERCKQMAGWIKDGLVENDVMYIGGAWSIDHARRTAGVTWWADEECSIEQFNQIIDTYAVARPRVVITHDCPAEAAVYMFQKPGLLWGGASAKLQKTRTASALQAMYEIHQPDFWFFGHWHITKHQKIGNTHFQCLGELDYVDFDLGNLEFKND
jgi:predicted phosphodiesterase